MFIRVKPADRTPNEIFCASDPVRSALRSPTEKTQLLDTPQDVPFFGKLLQREIVYRLLQGPQGDRLRSIATMADLSDQTAKAVSWLRKNFEKTLNVDELASMAGMSRSTLHHHFRGLTAMSPLQFQKQLRLHTARQKMLTEELDAASAAFEVGYESPSQFNREYKSVFGKPPMRDVQALRASLYREIITMSVFVCPAAQFLGRGSLRFCREPADLGAERGPTGAAGFRHDLRAGDQFVQSRSGFGSIGLLRPVYAGRDDQHAVFRGATAG